MKSIPPSNSARANEAPPLLLMRSHDKALKLSPFAGVAWSLISLDGNANQTITMGATMHGYPATELVNLLRSAPQGSELYLTCPPSTSYVDAAQFLCALECGGVVRVHLADPSPVWINALELIEMDGCNVEVVRYASDAVTNQAAYGLYTLAERKRPWVTCIVSSQVGGGTVDTQELMQDALCNMQITNTLAQHHALVVDDVFMYSPEQACNNAQALLPRYSVSSLDDVAKALKIQTMLGMPTLCVVAGTGLFKLLVEADFVDHVIYYSFILKTDAKSDSMAKASESPSALLSLEDWIVLDCNPFSKGVKIGCTRRML